MRTFVGAASKRAPAFVESRTVDNMLPLCADSPGALIARPGSPVATSLQVDEALAAGAVVALAVSGGADSSAVAVATMRHLDAVDHAGPRLMVHADLGRTEWKESLPVCERLAAQLGLELIVVRRPQGDLLSLWEQRWAGNVARYAAMRCARLILPWSTASMRFCTSQGKVDQINKALTTRFPGRTILSVTGVRADESRARAQAPVSELSVKLTARKCTGILWNPILRWSKVEVFRYLTDGGYEIHEAYRVYGSTRVSCPFCILGSQHDLVAAASCEANAPLYRTMVDLETRSSFAFKKNKWLADVAPHLLSAEARAASQDARERAARREAAEKLYPKELLYDKKGWPTRLPTPEEAAAVAEVRMAVATAVGIDIEFRTGEEVLAGYQALYEARRTKDG